MRLSFGPHCYCSNSWYQEVVLTFNLKSAKGLSSLQLRANWRVAAHL